MDWSLIIVAALSLIGTLSGSYWANHKNQALIAYRLEQLEKKVQQHNEVDTRVTVLEQKVEMLEDQLNKR